MITIKIRKVSLTSKLPEYTSKVFFLEFLKSLHLFPSLVLIKFTLLKMHEDFYML